VEVDQDGNSVAGSGVYQAANHQTPPFARQYDGSHPLLETCTSNNNMCDTVDDPMRFALSTRDVRPVELPVFPGARSPVMPSRPGLDRRGVLGTAPVRLLMFNLRLGLTQGLVFSATAVTREARDLCLRN
jgi:hypothetical protein